MIKLYNTMSRKVEEFQPIDVNSIKIYTCGPTVYDYPHIGNWYTFIRWDILKRTLTASGYDSTWVMNITDVGHLVSDADEGEDKLEKSAQREGKTAWEIAQYYTDYFVKGLEKLNFVRPSLLPRATEHIEDQINLVKKLETKDFTYVIDDGVYFDTSKLTNYGKLARLNIEEQKAGARVEYNPQKNNSTDFALWKFSPKNSKRDMEWESPWGKGFPGWHLECSALVFRYLGETIDIHAGGIDHIPVHHTNEIAQSESATGKPFANYWLHANFVQVNSQKMSKSLNNFYTLEDIEAKGYSVADFRLLVLESHYRSEAQFTWDTLTAAQNRLKAFEAMADLQFQAVDVPSLGKDTYDSGGILEALQDDLNTPQALSIISAKTDLLADKLLPKTNLAVFIEMLKNIDSLLGLKLSNRQDIDENSKKHIFARETARTNKDWIESDKIRDILLAHNIALRDTAHGPIWYRT